jgi:hypothetical protein
MIKKAWSTVNGAWGRNVLLEKNMSVYSGRIQNSKAFGPHLKLLELHAPCAMPYASWFMIR